MPLISPLIPVPQMHIGINLLHGLSVIAVLVTGHNCLQMTWKAGVQIKID